MKLVDSNSLDSLPTIVCAWCERVVAVRGSHRSHGICLDCYPRETGTALVSWWSAGSDDPGGSPPFGVFELDRSLRVRGYGCSGPCADCRPTSSCPNPVGSALFEGVLPAMNPFDVMRLWIERQLDRDHESERRFEYVLSRDGARTLLTFDCAVTPDTASVLVRFTGMDEAGMPVAVPPPLAQAVLKAS